MSHRVRLGIRVLALMSIVLFAVVIVIDTLDGWPIGPWQVLAVSSNTTGGLVYLGVGWLLAERQPRNPIGLLMLLLGVIYATFGPVDLYLSHGTDRPFSRLAGLIVVASNYPGSFLLATALILFPDGAPPSRRWWLIIVITAIGAGIGVAAMAFGSTPFEPIFPSIQSPFAVPGVPKRELLSIADTIGAMATLAGLIAVLIRWRRGTPVIRAQTTWLLAAVVITFLLGRVYEQVDDTYDVLGGSIGLVANFSNVLVPVAIAIAILRYHLYEIDRIVSRTIGWAVTTAVGLGAIAVTILMVSGVLGRLAASGLFGLADSAAGTAEETIVVALATLVVAAGIQPLRRRVQSRVDRWFHRAHYDAEHTATAFAGRLRSEVEMTTLIDDLRQTIWVTVEPSSTAIWLRASAR